MVTDSLLLKLPVAAKGAVKLWLCPAVKGTPLRSQVPVQVSLPPCGVTLMFSVPASSLTTVKWIVVDPPAWMVCGSA